MTRPLVLLTAGALLLAGCGGGGETTTPGTTAATSTGTTTAAGTITVRTFFYRDAALVPVEVEVAQTEAVATAAVERLLEGPPPGYETALPEGVRLSGIEVADGVATATFSASLGAPSRTAQAQIVSTLAQFPTVSSARIAVDGSGPVLLTDGGGRPLDGASPEDYVDLTAEAPIFVETPARDSTVSSPVLASGTANVFEATFLVEIWSGDRALRTEVITATSGTGTRGTWEKRLELPSGPVKLRFYEASAKDGSPQNETEVFLTVR
jgi:hypothetical protein